jgi:Phosphotransferase enzyme family
MLAYLGGSGRVASGLLDRHTAGFEQIRAAYPWQPEAFVSAHNDPNQFNLLYDGDRLWLIDWETASRNDPLTDIGNVCGYLAPTQDLRDSVLRASLGHEPDALVRARLALMGRLIQLYAGCILLMIVVDPAAPTHTDLTPMTVDEFRIGIEQGTLRAGTPTTTIAYAKIVLGAFVDGLDAPGFEDATRVSAAG